MTNKEIGKVLKSTADMIELTGGNPFRARSMASAARTIERWEASIEQMATEGTLTTIRGIGDGLAAQVTELVETGTFEAREDLIGAIPAGVMDMMRIKGLGAKKVRALWHNMGITTLGELEHAAGAGLIASQEGFGAKTQENILKNIELLRQYLTQRRYADVVTFATPMLEALIDTAGIDAVGFAGDLRRKMETIDRVDIVVQTASPDLIVPAISQWIDNHELFEQISGELTGRLVNGLPLHIYLARENEFGSERWQRTGSEAHISAFTEQFGSPGQVSDEHEIFSTAGIPFIPPELREGAGEIDAALEHALPALITLDDLRGTLHNHSTYSDGAHTLTEMAEAARSMELSYFGICDHSRSLVIANGLSAEEIRRQQNEIRELNARYAEDGGAPFVIFSGIESDILADGSLDYPNDVLASFDFVVASVHTRMNMNADDATDRVLKAIQNPYTRILGHPTGRILLVREGYPLHYERVLDACAEYGVAIELNANPYRLDLDWRWIRAATDRGILISINPDAHSIEGLKDMAWGVEVARKGWLTSEMCLNARSLDDFTAWIKQR